jgi:Proteasome subunit
VTLLSDAVLTPYTPENFVDESARSVKRFNALLREEDYFFEILIANHQGKNSELYHVDVSGNPEKVRPYKSIGSGADTADKFCAGLSFDTITMKDFTKRAFLATAYMDQHYPELRVGIGSGGIPLIKHMNYNQEWDKEITDLEECRNYANERLEKLKDCFEAILKE